MKANTRGIFPGPMSLLVVLAGLAWKASATTLYVSLLSSNPVPPYAGWETAATTIQDAVDVAEDGDVVLVTNGLYRTGGRAVNGYALTNRVAVDKAVIIQSVNGPLATVIQGYQVPNVTNGDSAVRCAYLTNNATLAGFTLTSGATRAAGDIYKEQSGGGAWCAASTALVSNCVVVANAAARNGGGVYGGTLRSCQIVSNINYWSSLYGGGGACQSTLSNCLVQGNKAGQAGGAMNCSLNNCMVCSNTASGPGGGGYSCTLDNCGLVANSATQGGGASYSTLNNCRIMGNLASSSDGGGAANCTLNNCLIISNSVGVFSGGGASSCRLNNCTIVGNVAAYSGGGLWNSGGTNCIIYYNTASRLPNYAGATTLRYSTTTPLVSDAGNITNAPLFIDLAQGNLRLQSGSPCINTGDNAYVAGNTDLDGRLRVTDGTIDMGAYEFQPDISGGFIGWLQQRGLAADGSADFVDSDGDGLNNWREWRAGTEPTNAASALRLVSATTNSSGLTVTWESVTNRTYFLERAVDLGAVSAFVSVATNIAGQANMTSFPDTGAVGPGPFFYRVGVQ